MDIVVLGRIHHITLNVIEIMLQFLAVYMLSKMKTKALWKEGRREKHSV